MKGAIHKGQIHKQKKPEEIGPDEWVLAPNRRNKRSAGQRSVSSGSSSVHDILRVGPHGGRKSGRGTGAPAWFKRMAFQRERRRVLRKVEMGRLAPAVGKVANRLQEAGFTTVWDVVSAESLSDFTSKGFKETEMLRVRAYLEQQSLSVKWNK